MLNVKSSREAVNSNFKVIGLTRLRIKPESTAQEADALTTRPSELFGLASLFNLNHYCPSHNILNLFLSDTRHTPPENFGNEMLCGFMAL